MNAQPVAILNAGLVTSIGLSAPATCAAIRAKISNPTEAPYIDVGGEPIMAHRVSLERPCRGRAKLSKMAAMAIDECLADLPRERWTQMPLLLCVAERDRPGRLEGLDDQFLLDLQQDLAAKFAPESAVVAQGRVGVALALMQARKLIYERNVSQVLIVASDSLLRWATLIDYELKERLLTSDNSNGFMPGEGAGALLVAKPTGGRELLCVGIGCAREKAHIDSNEPLRADGLTLAHKAALADAGWAIHDLDFRITDVAGEQYYFKEADLALSRLLRVRKEAFELWHPAECTGAGGAALGAICFAVAQAAFAKGYAPGRGVLLHFSDDAGQRASAVAFQG